MNSGLPPIVKSAERLLLEVEKAVSSFPRKYRYSLGGDLRCGALDAVLLSQEAFRFSRDKGKQAAVMDRLAEAIDKIKVRLQLGQRLQCYSFARFEEIGRIAADLGKQCGGWQKQIREHMKGQIPAAVSRRERPQILSTGIASHEANR